MDARIAELKLMALELERAIAGIAPALDDTDNLLMGFFGGLGI
jgi:hypothetical protein